MAKTPLYKRQHFPKRGRSHTMDKRTKFRYPSTADASRRPAPHSRQQCWVRSHTRNGHSVRGHFRKLSKY